MSDKRGSSFLNGLILGGVIGAVIAFFVSQKRGKDSFKGAFSELIAKGREMVQDAVQEGKETAARKEAEHQIKHEEE
mgnify:CR=1 FL=1